MDRVKFRERKGKKNYIFNLHDWISVLKNEPYRPVLLIVCNFAASRYLAETHRCNVV
jgi:hypothetical protein